METEPLRVVLLSEGLDWIGGYCGRRRDIRKGPTVPPTEGERAVGLSIHLVALLVYRAVVPATEQREVRQRGGPALRPVPHVMPLAQWEPAARETAAAVPMVQRSA